MYGNPERLRAVADAIEANPDHFDMATWVDKEGGAFFPVIDLGNVSEWVRHSGFTPLSVTETDPTECGTRACIAGWACWLYKDEAREHASFEKAGGSILGLSEEIAYNLFYGDWDVDLAVDLLRTLANGSLPDELITYDD